MRLKLFHEGKAPLANGHRRDTLLFLSDEEFESNHGFIQWAFPTNEKSTSNFTAPTLDLESAIWLAENPGFVTFLENMTARFLEFLQRNKHWVNSHDHNHLRISRAIKSIRILHSYELANWFYERVIEFAGNVISNLSMEERMRVCNMTIAAGARAGLIAPDEKTFDYLKNKSMSPKGENWIKAVNFWKKYWKNWLDLIRCPTNPTWK